MIGDRMQVDGLGEGIVVAETSFPLPEWRKAMDAVDRVVRGAAPSSHYGKDPRELVLLAAAAVLAAKEGAHSTHGDELHEMFERLNDLAGELR